jgi:hypothetical protein
VKEPSRLERTTKDAFKEMERMKESKQAADGKATMNAGHSLKYTRHGFAVVGVSEFSIFSLPRGRAPRIKVADVERLHGSRYPPAS